MVTPLATAPDRCLSLVMPCYDEAPTVARAIARALAQPFLFELIVVDDGSTDGTAAILDAIDDPRVRVLRHPVNRGKGAALRSGFASTTGPYVGVLDADLEYDPADLVRLLEPLLAGQADVVYGSRFLSSGARRVLYFWHSVGNRLLTLYSNMVTDLNLTDVETCFKLFRRDVLDRIVVEEDGFGVEPELTAKVAALGCRIFEMGISYRGRSYAEGKKTGWRDGVRAVWVITRYGTSSRTDRRRARRRPRRFSDADAELAGTLESLEGAVRYVAWIGSLILPHVRGRVLEVGAGHGTFSPLLAGAASELVVSEPSERAVVLLHERFDDHPVITVWMAGLEDVASVRSFDTAVLINVLEHIADDDKAFRLLHECLTPGGRVVVFVPAHELLYSNYDHSIGHHRRYRKPELVRKARSAGLDVVDARYVNAMGFFGWLGAAKLLRARPTHPRCVWIYDRAVVPVARAVESLGPPPFGQSVLLVAERPPAR